MRHAWARLEFRARLGVSIGSIVVLALPLAFVAVRSKPAELAPGRGSHTVVIVLENRAIGEVVGSEDASYFNGLIKRGALATHTFGLRHPSLPNYLALIGGSTFGIDEDCIGCVVSGPNLATQLSGAGITWRAYMGGMPESCFRGAGFGQYEKRHNPFMYFPTVTTNPGVCARVVPETHLDEDLFDGELPEFAWISPNLCDDGHDCPTATADLYLRRRVPGILRALGPRGLLVITFDEGTSNAGCCEGAVGGRIATLLLGSGARTGAQLNRPYDLYSVLATLEDRFGLRRLRHARAVGSLAPALTGTPDAVPPPPSPSR